MPEIDVSGATGGGSSITIYSTPDYEYYEYYRRGASVAHGSFAVGSNNNERIETVTLYLPGIQMKVKAADVRDELQALYGANRTWRDRFHGCKAGELDALESDRHSAFNILCTAVIYLAGRHLTIKHFETIASEAHRDGEQRGAEQLRSTFRNLLGVD